MTLSKAAYWVPIALAFACSEKLVADRQDPGTLGGHGGSAQAGGTQTSVSAGGSSPVAREGCATPDGHVVPYTTVKELEARIVGDWLQCSPDSSYPSEYGDGIRISADHTWHSLVQNTACGYDPLDTGFEGYGTWTAEENGLSLVQFNLFGVTGVSANYYPAFTDTDQLNLDGGGHPTLYVRMSTAPSDARASCGAPPSGSAGNGGSGGRTSDTGRGGSSGASSPEACAAPIGHVVPYTTAKELEARIVGDWLQCGPDGLYPSEYGDGIRILADHTWHSLVQNAACGYDPLSTGFDGYGTWNTEGSAPTHVQLNLLNMAGGAIFNPTFTDADQLNLDASGQPPFYVRTPESPDGGTSCGAPPSGSAGAAGAGNGGAGGSAGAGGRGGSGGASPEACAVPDGHVVPYTTAKELEARIVGDWLQCSPDASYPSQYGDGIRISADHTWHSLVQNAACGYDPLDTGFEGYGSWTAEENAPGNVQFNLFGVSVGAYYFLAFTDTGQLNLDAGGLPTVYVRIPEAPNGGASCAGGRQ